MSQVTTAKNDDLRSLVDVAAQPDRMFTPGTFLKSVNGSKVASGKVLPRGAHPFYGSIPVSTILLILDNLEDFKAAAIEAAKMAKRPGETERLIQAEEAKAAKKTTTKSATPKAATRKVSADKAVDDMVDELRGLDS